MNLHRQGRRALNGATAVVQTRSWFSLQGINKVLFLPLRSALFIIISDWLIQTSKTSLPRAQCPVPCPGPCPMPRAVPRAAARPTVIGVWHAKLTYVINSKLTPRWPKAVSQGRSPIHRLFRANSARGVDWTNHPILHDNNHEEPPPTH